MMGARVFVDTNILLRALMTDMPQHKECDNLLKSAVSDGTELWISGQVIREFIVQCTHPKTLKVPLTVAEVVPTVRAMQSLFKIADETHLVREWLLQLLIDHPTDGKLVHDANIVATMLTYEIDTLMTINIVDFRRFADVIKLVSPVPLP